MAEPRWIRKSNGVVPWVEQNYVTTSPGYLRVFAGVLGVAWLCSAVALVIWNMVQ